MTSDSQFQSMRMVYFQFIQERVTVNYMKTETGHDGVVNGLLIGHIRGTNADVHRMTR